MQTGNTTDRNRLYAEPASQPPLGSLSGRRGSVIMAVMESTPIVVPEQVRAAAEESIGKFFATISKTAPKAAADDHLDTGKSIKRAGILERYAPLENKKLLGDRLRLREQSGGLDQVLRGRRIWHGAGRGGFRDLILRFAGTVRCQWHGSRTHYSRERRDTAFRGCFL